MCAVFTGYSPRGLSVPSVSTQAATVEYGGVRYAAEVIAGGAAFELFAAEPVVGFLPNPRPDARWPFRRFVHVSEVGGAAALAGCAESLLSAPLAVGVTWRGIHERSQSPFGDAAARELLRVVRASAVVRCGTRMVKPLSARQVVRLLGSVAVVSGFCFREHDVAHLRTPMERRVLAGDPRPEDEVVAFALRWRAGDPVDYAVPAGDAYAGLARIPGSARRGGPVLGTGFAPSNRYLLPEFVTADEADVPLPARSEVVAYTEDGSEVTLFQYVVEQGAWTRMAGSRWADVLAMLPGVEPHQEWFPVPVSGLCGLSGAYRGDRHEAVADPPHGFRLRSKSQAARFPVTQVRRWNVYASWRGVPATVAGAGEGWTRLRLVSPDEEAVTATGAECVERGVYECWAPSGEVAGERRVEVSYRS